MKILRFLVLFFGANLLFGFQGKAQANPYIGVSPANSGLVAVGATLDLFIDVGNTGVTSIALSKLRPIVEIPSSVVFLPTAEQILPAGWTILTNNSFQIRLCNNAVVIPGESLTTITLKVRGVSISPAQTFNGQINFGNGTTCAAGPQVAGNDPADDFATSTIEVVPGCSLGINTTAGTILCNNGSTNITVTATAASGPVEYSLTGLAPFQPGNVFSNVAAGTYNVTVREVNNPTTCIISSTVTITEPAAIAAPLVTVTHPTCTNPNGVINLSNTDGLTFSVDSGAFLPYPTAGFLLPAGSHNIVAKSANDCTSPTTAFVINEQPVTPQTPSIGTVTQPDCNNNTGTIVLNDLPAGTWTIASGNITGSTTSTSITNLAAGTYSFAVTNAAGCTSASTASIDIAAVVDAPVEPSVTLTQPTCTIATGIIVVTSSTNGLNFSLDGGAFGAYPPAGYSGLTPGSHTLVAQNVNGCLSPTSSSIIEPQPASPSAPTVLVTQPNCNVATGTIEVSSTTTGVSFSLDGNSFVPYPAGGFTAATGVHTLGIQNGSGCAPNVTTNIVVNPQPATPAVVTAFTPISCFNGNSIITTTATGGIMPYEYSINTGTFQNENTFSVVAGAYTVAVKDANGCIGSSNNFTITEPTAISATASATTIACNGGTATLTVAASGGVGAYEYSLNNGNYQTNNSFTVPAGIYRVNVRLMSNPSCSAATNSTLTITQPNVLKATANANAISFCGGTTLARITGTGGTAPYSGTGSFVRGPGSFTFEVMDAKGCISSADLVIIPPGCVNIEVYPNPGQDIVTVNHSPATSTEAYLQMYSELGNRVLSQKIPQNNFKTTLDVAALSSGTYILIFTNGDEKKAVKFLKTN